MHHFFVKPEQIKQDQILIEGPDVRHMKNVLRIRPGEEILVSDGQGRDYRCSVKALEENQVQAQILSAESCRELGAQIWLFQGLPKGDKMELIIQKAVELGAAGVVPVATKNAVVRLEGKKEEAKLRRWQAISESAAKQSKRSLVPEINPVMSLKEAFRWAVEQGFELCLIPYENQRGMEATREAFEKVALSRKIGVFIGPEGGFAQQEIDLAQEYGVLPISLGARILRTETAGLAVLSALMLRLEGGI